MISSLGKSMPKPEREKGRRRENQIVQKLLDADITARRISRPYVSSDDIEINTAPAGVLTGEVKARKDGAGWKTIAGWKREADVLFLVADRTEPLVVIEFDLLVELITQGTPL
jgi:hypothetical protein